SSDQLQPANSSATSSELNSEKANSASEDVASKTSTDVSHPVSKPTRKGQPSTLVIFEKGKQVFPQDAPAQVSAGKDSGNQAEEQTASKSADGKSVVTISEDVAEERLLTRVEPDYPESARQQRLQGTVILDVRVDKRGAVNGLSQVSGDP